MARSCLIAAVCASVRRSARSVSAFNAVQLSSHSTEPQLTSTVGLFGLAAINNRQSPSSSPLMTRLMSTTASSSSSSSSSTDVIKRVKTSEATASDDIVAIKGWVRTVRKQKTLAFVEVNDGSSLAGIQCVLPFDEIDEASNEGEDSMS